MFTRIKNREIGKFHGSCLTNTFKQDVSVKQGDNLSPNMFKNLLMIFQVFL